MNFNTHRVKTFEEWYPEYTKGMHYAVVFATFPEVDLLPPDKINDAFKAIADAAFQAGKAYGIYCMDLCQ